MRQRQAGYIATNEHSIAAMLQFYLRDAAVFRTSEAIRYDFMPPLDQVRLRHASGIYLAMAPDDDLARLHAIEAYRVYELKGYRGGLPY